MKDFELLIETRITLVAWHEQWFKYRTKGEERSKKKRKKIGIVGIIWGWALPLP